MIGVEMLAGRVAETTLGCPIQSRSVRLSGVKMLPAIPRLPLGPNIRPFFADASGQQVASHSQRSPITSDL